MAIRPTMTGLIELLRPMVDDNDAPYTFSDERLQQELDRSRIALDGVPLTPDSARTTWYSEWPNLEVDLRDVSGATINPTSSDPIAGVFVFDTAPDANPYMYGYAYDLNRAAAGLWLQKAGATSNWRGSFQQYAQMQHNFYLSLSWPRMVNVERV